MCGEVLQICGVNESRIDDFREKFDAAFGSKAETVPLNIVNPKQFDVKTPNVSIKLSSESIELLETRVING